MWEWNPHFTWWENILGMFIIALVWGVISEVGRWLSRQGDRTPEQVSPSARDAALALLRKEGSLVAATSEDRQALEALAAMGFARREGNTYFYTGSGDEHQRNQESAKPGATQNAAKNEKESALPVPSAIPPPEIVPPPAKPDLPESWVKWVGIIIGGVLAVCLLGGLIATFQKTTGPAWTQEEKENAAHFFRSESAVEAGFASIRPVVDPSKPSLGLTQSDARRALAHLKLALSEAKSVRAQVLGKAHPQLPVVYREKYIRSLELAIIGPSGVGDLDAVALRNQWNDWWAANKNDVHFPKDVLK
jgi:hypothetical protein